MKYFLAVLLVVSQWAVADECRTERISQMTGQRTVGAVTDLIKNKSHNKCQVKFRINVDGEWHNINWTHDGPYQEEILCQMAIRNGMNELLVQLPGQFKTESNMVCKSKEIMPVTLGYEGNESEFGQDRERKMYFKIDKVSKCRMFKDHYLNGVSKKISGVICLNNNELWTIVDKF